MEMTIRSTSKIVELNGVPARVWEGISASGIRVHAYITRVAVARGDDVTEFQLELQECEAPTPEVAGLPRAMHL